MSESQQELATTFTLPTLEVAKKLLGMKLNSVHRGKKTSGMIVEVEAYHGDLDEASHAFSGRCACGFTGSGPIRQLCGHAGKAGIP